ncbi:MAG: hypothetical protein L6Q98_20015 [Anaerolineae bacterium]|nr:hypothetical protein [Anaerolineae bacterium]NUQ05850.1 hypothetical protein [Anaerolineae bacterium]
MARALLDWAEAVGWQRGSVLVYLLVDGQYRFSETSVVQQVEQIVEESRLSDRLLLIICAAHLEDQIRMLLAQFLIDDKLVEDMFERSSAAFMTSLAFSLGLIAKEWHDVLKGLSHLRNIFAHQPEMRSFDVLLESEPKASQTLDAMKAWLRIGEESRHPREVVINAVLRLVPLLQFSIDHVAKPDRRVRLEPSVLVDNVLVMGISRDVVKQMLDEDWVSLSNRE